MAIISFGKIDKKIIPIILGGIFSFISRFLFTLDIISQHSIVSNILSTLPRILALIPYIILKIRSKGINNDDNDLEENQKTGTNLIFIDLKDKLTKNKWIYILITSIIFFVQGILLVYTAKIITNSWIYYILFTCIFCYFIFKIKVYLHHYVSIVLIILAGLIPDLALNRIQSDISDNAGYFFLRLLREILFSFHDVIIKYTIEYKFCSVYELCFYNGIICTILLFLFVIFDYYFFKFGNYEEFFDQIDGERIFIIIMFMIVQLGVFMCNLFTNRDHTPFHIFIIYAIGQFGFYIRHRDDSMIVLIICQILILFLSLIFTEIIEINCFGLSKNTKKNISIRAFINDSKILELTDYKDDDFEIEESTSKQESYNELQVEQNDKKEEGVEDE